MIIFKRVFAPPEQVSAPSVADARRQLVLGTPVSKDAWERADSKREAARHMQRASLEAVRAGRQDVAEALLLAWERLDKTA
jgi:hypothetical protein